MQHSKISSLTIRSNFEIKNKITWNAASKGVAFQL
jgi:hypothetical protein